MSTHTSKYCSIHGYDFGSIVYADGVGVSGGGSGVEEVSVPGRNYADVRDKGRNPKKYKIKARSTDRDEIEAFLREINTMPEEAEFCPFDAGRRGYIARAYAGIQGPGSWGAGKNFYEADAEITCREAWLYGADQGIDMAWATPTPAISDVITNDGHERAPISYLQASGDYIPRYVEGLKVRITPGDSDLEHDRELKICDKLLRGDRIELGWRGEVWHSWKSRIISVAGLGLDVHGLMRGGTVLNDILTLSNTDYLMIPFWGPLSMSGEPGSACIEVDVTDISGDGVSFQKATGPDDIANMTEIDHDEIVVGRNVIYIPGLEGETDVSFGLQAAISGSISISSIKARVKRYVAPSKIPWADPDEDFRIRVESSNNQRLRFLQACWNSRYWY